MINPDQIISARDQITPEIISLVDVFTSPEGIGRRYLIGRNEHSEALAKAIDIDGIVDDFADPGTVWNDKPVVKGGDVPKDAIIVNCSMSISPISAHKRIESLGVAVVLAYADLCQVFPDRFPYPDFVLETQNDIRLHKAKWEALSYSLADDESKQVLDDLLSYRLTGNYRYMKPYSVRLKDQYFEDFLGLGVAEIFVDAGGFDGDTTQEYCKRYPSYEKIYIFEPSSNNIANARERLRDYRAVNFIQRGLSDSNGTLFFNPDDGSASSVSESGSCKIDVTTLDQQVDEKVTFIKMDLEGWELKALEGSKRHILEDHPKLAISVYHHPSDFWRIFEFIINLRQDYKVFLRHYTEGWSETVLFFVPKLIVPGGFCSD
jgi:FkbM family methyltransferase